ncbi:conserved Plasmodium protein, unknown function [Plasmodium malariae]|uniref:Uncharacterized protein n=1 Tax=Plasmodium malariae TaxID=5858 RepID=A0A1C3KBC6_PLAMA|nr:conserved Plasmodium protein, unknown function [Plasmodium malariae]
MNNEYKCTSKGNKESVEIIYTDNKNKVLRNDGVRKGEILYEETSRKEVYLMNELHNMKNNLFDNTPFSNYIHFYEIYNNLKYIVKYEKKKKKGQLFFIYTTSKRYCFYFLYIFFLIFNICLLFRLQTLVKFPFFGYNYYYMYEIHFHVFFTFFVLTYSVLNIYLFFFTYKNLIYHTNVLCLIIIQTLYNTYIKEKNKEIYRNTEILIEGCKRVLHAMGDGSDQLFDNKRNDSLGSSSNIESIGGTHNYANNGGNHNFANNGGTHNFANTSNSYNFDHSTNPYNFPNAANFDNIVLLYADSIFNKFTNIFMYINKECYKRGNVSRNSIRYEDDFIEVEVARQAERAPSDLGDDLMTSNTDRSSNAYIQGNNKKASFLCRQKYTDGMHVINKDLVKKLNYAQSRENEKCSYNNGSRRSIYNIFGNSIYSDIDDINIYMKYKENYIHSLMMDKCKEKLNYIKFIFYFIPYVINLFINMLINFYVLFSVYYYNNRIPLAPSYELSKLHILNILNYKGIYYILFIFFHNFFFFLYLLFLYKLNTIYFFLRQIYKQCKYESIYYCEHVMNAIYENFIFPHTVQVLLKKKRPQNSRNKLKDNQEEAYTPENNLQKRMTHTQGLNDQSWFEQRGNKMNQTDQAAQTNQAINLADSNPFTTNTSTHCQRLTRDMHSQKGHTK